MGKCRGGRLRRGNDERGISKKEFWSANDAFPRGEEGGAARREQNALGECEVAAGEDARGPVPGRPRPQRAGVRGGGGKFRQASSVIPAAGEDARGPLRAWVG